MMRRPIGRRQLGSELRRLRIEAKRQQREMAEVIECDASQISKVERGERTLKALELNALLDFLKVRGDKRDEMLALGEEARKRQPRKTYSDILSGTFRRLGDLEEDASEIYCFADQLIPGLLQIPDYIRALVTDSIYRTNAPVEAEMEARITFRLDRQRVLELENRISFLIGESALLRPVGGPAVLRRQLLHVLGVIDGKPWITVRVVPLTLGVHPLLGGALSVFRFCPGVDDVVHQSTVFGGGVYLDEVNETRECLRAFKNCRERALGPAETRRLLLRRVRELAPG
ncbi:Helix-turn-helix domain-containing protein [Amycolatopsis xylanica]|uniref:Helix-turn-helix domain-containing protein n=1 Tax=Amycolatopsis xylanica TaxID=589385 RepID=A0A1H3NF25_9PSEU|nr:helix-turn-helix transcriptional regulator [Amycolatopsis xylanica]SDY87522.1 Helix-turn-helix domain-containing protein [Amycolatopsis xylanica]